MRLSARNGFLGRFGANGAVEWDALDSGGPRTHERTDGSAGGTAKEPALGCAPRRSRDVPEWRSWQTRGTQESKSALGASTAKSGPRTGVAISCDGVGRGKTLERCHTRGTREGARAPGLAVCAFVTSRVIVRSAAAPRRGPSVLVGRRDVDQRGGVADRRVLAVRLRIVGARHLVARPAAPGLRAHQRRGARMERRGLEHDARRIAGGRALPARRAGAAACAWASRPHLQIFRPEMRSAEYSTRRAVWRGSHPGRRASREWPSWWPS